jgi:hypothetical protein
MHDVTRCEETVGIMAGNDLDRVGLAVFTQNFAERMEDTMVPQSTTAEPVKVESRYTEVRDLAQIMSRTLPEAGMDRMTSQRIEEVLAVPALTAHI